MNKKELAGIGIGAPGILSRDDGVIKKSPNFPKWKNFSLGRILSEQLAVPVVLDNDANVVTLGEAKFGAAKGVESFICLTLGSGVGGGIFLDGKLWRGVDGMAGELGHIVVEPEGFPCGCGGKGCLEQYASRNGLMNFVRSDNIFKEMRESALMDPALPEKLADAALKGDARFIKYFETMGYYLGIGIAGLLNIFNVKLILLCGGISRAYHLFSKSMWKEIKKRTYRAVQENAEVRCGILLERAGVLGAASLLEEE